MSDAGLMRVSLLWLQQDNGILPYSSPKNEAQSCFPPINRRPQRQTNTIQHERQMSSVMWKKIIPIEANSLFIKLS